MRSRTKFLRFLPASLLAAVLSSFAAQQAEPPKNSASKQEAAQTDTPAVIRAEVIGLGAKMAESAPAGFLKWARSYAKREILGGSAPPEDEAVQKTFDERFPKSAPSARAAGAFLLWYQAYQHASDDQQVFQQRISDVDREIRNLESDLIRFQTTTPSLGDPARNARASNGVWRMPAASAISTGAASTRWALAWTSVSSASAPCMKR